MIAFKGNWPKVYKKLIKKIKDDGEIVGKFKTINNVSFEIDPRDILILPEKNWKWAFAELYDRLHDNFVNPGTSYQFRPHWKKKLDYEGGKFVYTYNERFGFQLEFIYNILSKNKYSREAVISVFDRNDPESVLKGARVPCTLTLHFYIFPKNVLNLSVNMRTNDAINLLIYDVFHHSFLLLLMASRLNLKLGSYFHFSSLVYYQKKREIRGYIDRLTDNDIFYYSIPFTNYFYDEFIKIIHHLSTPNLDISNVFLRDLYNFLKNLYFEENNDLTIEFFRRIK